MISALFFLQFQQTKNRLTARLRRLRKPKYLAGAMVGILYFYLSFVRYFFVSHAGTHRGLVPLPSGTMIETLAAALLFIIVLGAWLIPHGRAAMVFSEAEITFLFPAPVRRGTLIHYKLVESQVKILVSIFFLTLLGGRFRSGGSVWIHVAGWWLVLSTLNLHLLGSSFARTLLLDRGVLNWQRRAVFIGGIVVIAGVSLWSAWETLPPVPSGDFMGLLAMAEWLQAVAAVPPTRWALEPFRWMARPFLASNGWAFAQALGPALLLLVGHYVWVVRSDVAFEEASLALSRRHADRLASAARTGRGVPVAVRRRRSPFPLAPTGPRAVALLWKNLISAGQFTFRFVLLMAWMVLVAGLAIGRTGTLGEVLGLLALNFVGITMVFGSMIVRQDLRQDLAVIDILKTYPMPGWQIVLGELLAPAVILTVLQWLLMLLAAALFAWKGGEMRIARLFLPATAGVCAAILAPALNLLSLLIPNAAVLLLPAWFQTGPGATRGLEATGQRLIFLVGQLVVLLVAVVPAAAIAFIVIVIGHFAGMPGLGEIIGCALAALTLTGEAVLALIPLGRLFERLDVSADLGPRG